MRHEFFKSVGNARLSLRNIESLEIRPKSRMQMILGTNGSGKSAVMDLLSLHPPVPGHYAGGGRQEHLVTHRGSTYEFLYDFSGTKNHYQITKDGEVAYSGHVASVCSQYIQEKLGLSKEIHEVCISKKRFTEMKASERRSWFTKLSPIDYSYAIGFHKRLGEAHRDIDGTVKRLSDKLVQERDKAIDTTRADLMRSQIAELKKDKDELLKIWSPSKMTVSEALTQVSDIDKQVEQLHTKFMASVRVFGSRNRFKDLEELRKADSVLRGNLTYHEQAIKKLFTEIEDNNSIIIKNRHSASQNIDELYREVERLTSDISTTALCLTYVGYPDNKSALTTLESIYSELTKTISQFSPDPDNEITKINYEILVVEYNRLDLAIMETKSKIDKASDLIHQYEHSSDQDMVNCPKCEHSFNPKASEHQYHLDKSNLPSLVETLRELTKQKTALTEKMKHWGEQLQLHSYFFMMLTANKQLLEPLWTALMVDRLVKARPAYAIGIIEIAHRDLRELIKIDQMRQSLDEITATIKVSEQSTSVNLLELEHRNAILDKELYFAQSEAAHLKKNLAAFEAIYAEWTFQDSAIESLERFKVSRDYLILQAEEANKRAVINSMMSSLESDILTLEKAISQSDNHKAIIESIEKDVDNFKRRSKFLKHALDALSPTKGLIARGLTGFVNHFVEQMNSLIAKVWLYPLVVSPVEVSEGSGEVDLDYNFTYTYDGKPGAPDVSGASGAQREIIDVAFMLVFMKNLGLEDYPVFLDEFSIKMDYAHRRESLKMISELLVNSNFSQIFMVSHYEGSYGSLSNADITVLCPENIEIPPDLPYNINATIVKS